MESDKKRLYIGKGKEHQVWQAQNPQWVLKKPTYLGKLLLILSGKNAYSIRDEIRYSESLTANTPIKIPETHVYIFKEGKSYIIKQKKVIADQSNQDTKQYLKDLQLTFFLNKYTLNKSNFIWQNGQLYWVDPTRGFSRLYTSLGISWETWINTMGKLVNFFTQ